MINAYLYKKGKPFEANLNRTQMFQALADKDSLLWVDMEDPTEFENDSLVELFNFHPLAIEDCINDCSQPKADDYEEYLFLVVHGVNADVSANGGREFLSKELDIFLGKNFVVTYHKVPLRSLSQVREVVIRKPEIVMGNGADLLVHSILDHLVDNYMPLLDTYDEKLDVIEEEIFKDLRKDYLAMVMLFKKNVFHLRRIISPQRDTLHYLAWTPTAFIKPKNRMYFRDIYDHLFQIYGSVEGLHEGLSGILQAYFSYSSHKLNEVMKRMTVLATLTMPSIIIASIYGMNFENMPELKWPFGYYASIGLMFFTSFVMLVGMKFKKWI